MLPTANFEPIIWEETNIVRILGEYAINRWWRARPLTEFSPDDKCLGQDSSVSTNSFLKVTHFFSEDFPSIQDSNTRNKHCKYWKSSNKNWFPFKCCPVFSLQRNVTPKSLFLLLFLFQLGPLLTLGFFSGVTWRRYTCNVSKSPTRWAFRADLV